MPGKNCFIPRTNDIVKFVLNIVAAVTIVAGIVLWPIKAKIQSVEKDIAYLKKEYNKCRDTITDKLDEKVSKEALGYQLKPIEQSINELKDKIEAFQVKNESFQQQLFDILRRGPS